MAKQVALLSDLSAFGRCSLSASISVLSAMGFTPCAMPTAVLSAQSEFPVYYSKDLTEIMPRFKAAWLANGESFDGICTGYFTSGEQISQAVSIVGELRGRETLVLIDPVMGDNGRLYPSYDGSAAANMRKLVKSATVITPNLTELCLLAGTDFRRFEAVSDSDELISAVKSAAEPLADGRGVIVTGISADGFIANIALSGGKSEVIMSCRTGESFSGTGDIFSAVTAGCLLRGDTLFEAAETAASFVEKAAADTVKEPHDPQYGVNYEKFLKDLAEVK